VIPGNAKTSLLYQAASHSGELKMPPGQPSLLLQDPEVLRQWIDQVCYGMHAQRPSLARKLFITNLDHRKLRVDRGYQFKAQPLPSLLTCSGTLMRTEIITIHTASG
jgi:hypothetical protein